MNLKQLSEDNFLAVPNLTQTSSSVELPAADMEQILLGEIGGRSLSALQMKRQCGGYQIVALGNTDTALLDASGSLVGYYIGDVLVIDPSAQGKGPSTPLILEAVGARPTPSKRIVS